MSDLSFAGDVWYFPPGVPHSIQAFEQGAELLLVFDDVGFFAYLYSLSFTWRQIYRTLSLPTKDMTLSISLENLTTKSYTVGFPFIGTFNVLNLAISSSQYHNGLCDLESADELLRGKS